jgi:hypothetical protein
MDRGRFVRRLVVGLNRVGVSVRGAQELRVKDKSSDAVLRALVFPVSVDDVEYLVSTRPQSPWVKSLRAARTGELRVGRHRRNFHTAPVDDVDALRVLQAFKGRVPPLLSRATNATSRQLVFRVVAGQPSDSPTVVQ